MVACAIGAAAGLGSGVGHAADPGQQAFAECASCHSVDGSPGVGPTLKGVVGRASASVPGFAYSSAFKRSHLKWTPDELDKYVADPQSVVPGNVMPYAGMSDPAKRAALIAYLATLE
jgi:cytochrome c